MKNFLKNVDAVYIASPNETHFEYAKKAIEAGKHVLSEKPLSFTKKESEVLYTSAKEKGVVLMEAVKAAHCPRDSSSLSMSQKVEKSGGYS